MQIAMSPDSPVGMYVMSPHHFTFGMPASKSRPSRGRPGSLINIAECKGDCPPSGRGHASGFLPPLLWPGFDRSSAACGRRLGLATKMKHHGIHLRWCCLIVDLGDHGIDGGLHDVGSRGEVRSGRPPGARRRAGQRRRAVLEALTRVHGRDARHPRGRQPPGAGERAGRNRPRHRLPRQRAGPADHRHRPGRRRRTRLRTLKSVREKNITILVTGASWKVGSEADSWGAGSYNAHRL